MVLEKAGIPASETIVKSKTEKVDPTLTVDPNIRQEINEVFKVKKENTVERGPSIRSNENKRVKADLLQITNIRDQIKFSDGQTYQTNDPYQQYALNMGEAYAPGTHKTQIEAIEKNNLGREALNQYRREIDKREPKKTLKEKIQNLFSNFFRE